jgi:tetratricopeptide (TPR) repeat protein
MASASGGREFKILLGLAELCQTAVPPRVQESVVCLEAALSLTPPNEEARVRRNTALLLLQQLGDKAGAKRHLERACQVRSSSDVHCDVIHHLARLYQEEGNLSLAESLLKKGVQALRACPRSHFRLTFQLAELLSNRGDNSGVAELLANGAQYAAQTGTLYSQILLLLNQVKVMVP